MKILISSLILLATLLSAPAFSYYYDHPEVLSFENAGTPKIHYRSNHCATRSYRKQFDHELKVNDFRLCVEQLPLPKNVLSEVLDMKENEIENESDYDSRLTRFYIYANSTYTPRAGVSIDSIQKLAQALGVPNSQLHNIEVSSYKGSSNQLHMLEGLVVENNYVDNTESLKYLRQLIKGKQVLQITLSNSLELYPGGGLNTDYYILIIEGKIVFLKNSWWDA